MFKEIVKKIKSQSKGLVIGSLVTGILMSMTTGLAESQSITAFFNNIKLQINGKVVDTGSDKPFIYNGRTYVPARYVAEGLGASVKWNETSNTVEIDNLAKEVTSVSTPIPIPMTTPTPTSTPLVSSTPSPTSTPITTATPTSTPTPVSSNYVFRKVLWGMSKQEVKNSETGLPTNESKNFISYQSSIDSKDCKVMYAINDKDQLCGIVVDFNNTHANKNDFIDDYKSLSQVLSAKYGSSDYDKPTWKSETFKNMPSQYGLAVSCGDLYYNALWTLPDATIFHLLDGDNYKIRHGVLFKNTKLEQPKQDSGM